MKRTALAISLVVAFVLPSTVARPLNAQLGGGLCGLCSDYNAETGLAHLFAGFGGGALFACGETCHRYLVAGICYDNHGGCNALNEKIEKVRLALNASDVSSLRAALDQLRDRAAIDRSGHAIEVFGCGQTREVVARFPAPEPVLTALAAQSSAIPQTAVAATHRME
jgi:hypothetical protein